MSNDVCPMCGGMKQSGTTTFTVDYNLGMLVVRNVPATIYSQCGEEWIADTHASRLESFAANARNKKSNLKLLILLWLLQHKHSSRSCEERREERLQWFDHVQLHKQLARR